MIPLRHLPVLQWRRAEESHPSLPRQVPEATPKRWQRCFPAVLGVEEVEAQRLRRKRGPRPVTLRGEWADPDTQMEFWPAPRPPLARPKSYFAKKGLSKVEQAFGKAIVDDEPGRMPLSRQECIGKDEPCPFVRCRHHLAIDVNDIGSAKVNFPGWSIVEMTETCSLNVAMRGPATTERVAALMNLSTERIRQIEREAWRKIARRLDRDRLLRGPREGV